MDYSKLPKYLLFFILFIIGQSLSMWGQYVTLPFKNISIWEAFKMAIPFAWMDWFVMTFAIQIGNDNNLVTPTQDMFVLIIVQFCILLIINQYYLKQHISRSDIITFFIILFGFFVSFDHALSKILKIPIDSKYSKLKYSGVKYPGTNSTINKTDLDESERLEIH